MKIEITLKVIIDTQSDVSIEDDGLKIMIKDDMLDPIWEFPIGFRSDKDKFIECGVITSEIIEIKENNDMWKFEAFKTEQDHKNKNPFYQEFYQDFDEMKIFSGEHSHENKTEYPDYCSTYDKIINTKKEMKTKKEEDIKGGELESMVQDVHSVIKSLDIKVMYCRSGDGLMSYGYSFIQIGGFVGQSLDDVKKSELWDGDYTKGDTVLDYRSGVCEKISKDKLKEIIYENN